MKKHLIVFQLLLIIAGSEPGFAVTLLLQPSSPNITIGSTTTVDLNISDLGGFAPPSLGAFFTEITFDNSVLSFDSVIYGALLGDPSDPLETNIVTNLGSNTVSLDEFSFLFDFELDAIQPDSFTLATLSFTGGKVGTSNLGFGTIDLSNAEGNSIANPTLQSASVNVVVPEPLTLLLLGTGFLGLVVLRYEQSKDRSWSFA